MLEDAPEHIELKSLLFIIQKNNVFIFLDLWGLISEY